MAATRDKMLRRREKIRNCSMSCSPSSFAGLLVKKLKSEAVDAEDIIATSGHRLRQVSMCCNTPMASTTVVIVGASVLKLITHRMQVVDMLSAKSFSEDAVKVIHEYILAANSLGLEVLSSEDFAPTLNKILGPLASEATVKKTLGNAAWPGGAT